MQLGIKEMLTDMVQMEKSMAMSYCQVQLEAANKTLRTTLGSIEGKVQENHGKLFHELHQRGWYKTPTAGQQAIESTIISWEQKFQKEPELSPNSKQ